MGNTVKQLNLADMMQQRLPAEIIRFIRQAGETSERRQQRLYLVGGAVRDLLLGRDTVDIDLVVEGDGITLAEALAGPLGATVTAHRRFGTATLKWDDRSTDIATARAESYAKPGALPRVRPGTLKDDLARRDFTVNAMAVEVNPRHYGELIDPHGGRQDLRDRAVRVLHEKSFTDDATRIWRAVRYEQRLDFTIEPMTLLLLKRDLPMLKTITGTRIRHELELVLREAEPEKALRRAADLGALEQLHPSLTFDTEQTGQFSLARERYAGISTLSLVYMGLLSSSLDAAKTEAVIDYLHPTRPVAQVLRETAAMKVRGTELGNYGPAPSRIYATLHGYSLPTLMAAAICARPETAEQIELYLDVLRHVKPALSGGDLKKLGVPEGPQMKEILQTLRESRLDGVINSKAEEEDTVRRMLKTNSLQE